ncbi:MAG: site-specific integrase, partial [Acidobacteria bacterium]|nr:site-specific integrase [Acidobacteriota bacterium]
VRETFSSGRFGSPKTKKSIRDVPMSEQVVELLTAHRQRCGPVDGESLVFPDTHGSPMNWQKRLNQGMLHPICKQLGLPKISWHSFRHSQATLMGQTGEPQRTAQAILGHGSSKTTDQYIHSVPESERRVMDKVAELLFPTVPNLGKKENGSKHLPN